ncbi:hypothetical protein Droror1_Dr00001929 [Drosera rotundifolia]
MTYQYRQVKTEFLEALRSNHTCLYGGNKNEVCYLFVGKFSPNSLTIDEFCSQDDEVQMSYIQRVKTISSLTPFFYTGATIFGSKFVAVIPHQDFHSHFTFTLSTSTTPPLTPLPSPSASPAATSRFNSLRTQTLRHASRFLRQTTTSRRLMREHSMLVREAAAAQFEERQTEWVYSRPVVVMDVLWNLGFVVVAAVVLGLSWDEKPGVPVWVWVAGYGVLCGLHVGCCSGCKETN